MKGGRQFHSICLSDDHIKRFEMFTDCDVDIDQGAATAGLSCITSSLEEWGERQAVKHPTILFVRKESTVASPGPRMNLLGYVNSNNESSGMESGLATKQLISFHPRQLQSP